MTAYIVLHKNKLIYVYFRILFLTFSHENTAVRNEWIASFHIAASIIVIICVCVCVNI